MSRLRVQVDSFGAAGTRTTVLYLEQAPPEIAAKAEPIIEKLVAELVNRCGLTRADARLLLFAELVEHLADVEAYEREAARRGLLPL